MNEEKDDFMDPICKCINIKDKKEFTLSKQEIKHIRRCLSFYSNVHDRIYTHEHGIFNLNQIIYNKLFISFGRMQRKLSKERKIAKLKSFNKKCNFEGCEEKDNLTIDHIKPLASTLNAHKKENLELLCPKHHLLKELNHILWQKGLETEKLKKRIEDIEKAGTTDCLGYQVLSKNKFENLDIKEEEIQHD